VTAPVELLDVYPTLAELTRGVAPAGLEGRSLVGLMAPKSGERRPPAATMVYHYDVIRRVDVMSRTVITDEWRYTEWDGGRGGRELYLRAADAGEYFNRAGEAGMAANVAAGAAMLKTLPVPKPGPANRPRALLPTGETSK
jgi:uncharacterized sulfatase